MIDRRLILYVYEIREKLDFSNMSTDYKIETGLFQSIYLYVISVWIPPVGEHTLSWLIRKITCNDQIDPVSLTIFILRYFITCAFVFHDYLTVTKIKNSVSVYGNNTH